MSTLDLELFDALIDAGADREKAKAAASSPSSIDARLATLETKINLLYGFIAMVQGAVAVWLKYGAAA